MPGRVDDVPGGPPVEKIISRSALEIRNSSSEGFPGQSLLEFPAPNGKVTLFQYFPFNGKIDINTAPKDILTMLPGIGESSAELIILHRMRYGPLKTESDLNQIMGIGQGTIETIAPLIDWGDATR